MAVYLSPLGNEAQIDSNGDPLVGGKIYTYLAGTSTAATTYTDDSGGTPQANPIVLNANGLPDSPIWLTGGASYKFIFKTSADATLRTVDDITGLNDPAQTTTISEWILYGSAPTYISTTSFSVTGDQTGTFQVNRRVKTTNTGGTIYSLISASSYSSGTGLTTVTVVNDSGTLDSGLSAVSYGLLSVTNPSIPEGTTGKALRISGTPAAGRSALYSARSDVASAATVDLSAVTTDDINITGTTTITAFTIASGRSVRARFNASLTLTNNASIVTQSGANIITRAGDTCILVATAANTVSVQNYTRANPIALQSSVATTSGTSVDVTGIPADANRVTIDIVGLSSSGTSPPQIQAGNGSVVTSGYLGSNALVSNAATTAALFTAGFGIGVNTSSWAATVVAHGSIVLTRQTGNTWVCNGSIARSDVAGVYITSGSIALGSALDRIRLTTAGGAETFDAGSISVSWE